MREEEWLATLFHEVWDSKFPDVKKRNNVLVRWKGRWKNKFGHIKRLKNKDTEIVVNSLFKDERVPKEVIELTIAHEIVHYMHGFNSPYEKRFKYPHQGGVVERELRKRGYNELVNLEKSWSKSEWPKILGERNNRDGVVRVKQLRSSFRLF
ncbi:MAG: SprT-like domain-containing protein [Nanoarchaeota archaeon]